MGVHRDTRNADLSYRSFAGSYEEPAILPGSNRYSGGRFVRRCQIRYYPSNRTASVVVLNDARKLDQRKGKMITPETPRGKNQSVTQGSVSFLSPEFTRERHLCQKCIPKGSTSRSQPGMLSSTVMEQADFTAAPRTGRALDFVYRMSLFESPMVDLGSKRFTVHDSSSQSSHRADASSLEMSDAALSAALLVIGRDFTGSEINNSSADDGSVASTRSHVRNRVEFGPDGFPIIWLKYSKKLPDGTTSTEIKPLRTSFVRASLLVTATRQEAQLQVSCQQDSTYPGAQYDFNVRRRSHHVLFVLFVSSVLNQVCEGRFREERHKGANGCSVETNTSLIGLRQRSKSRQTGKADA